MTCREFTEFIADFLDGGLPDAERQQFERHLSVCVNCARYLAAYRQTVALGKRAFADNEAPLPGDVPEDLINAILLTRRSSTSGD